MATQVKKILVIDDEKDFVTTIKYFLEMNGYEVTVAYDGITALEKVKKLSNLNLILLDIGIPGIDGFEVLRRLRINPATKRIPIIMLSCRTDTPSIFAAKGLKATDYIIKTMEFEKMLPILKRHLDKDKIKPIDI